MAPVRTPTLGKPSGGSGYAYVIWDGTQQKSVIASSTIKGTIKEGGAVQAKWRGVMYAATIVKTGSQPGTQ